MYPYFDRYRHEVQRRLRPLQQWFGGYTAQLIGLVVLVVLFFIVQHVVG